MEERGIPDLGKINLKKKRERWENKYLDMTKDEAMGGERCHFIHERKLYWKGD